MNQSIVAMYINFLVVLHEEYKINTCLHPEEPFSEYAFTDEDTEKTGLSKKIDQETASMLDNGMSMFQHLMGEEIYNYQHNGDRVVYTDMSKWGQDNEKTQD